MAAEQRKVLDVPMNINEEYYQISGEILSSFPKFRPPVDLFRFREDIAVLAPYCVKGSRLTSEQVDEVAQLCAEGDLFVSRSDHPIYSRHIVKQLDLVLQDNNLKEAEIADICIRALLMRCSDFFEQPVKALFEPLYRDVMVVTEYLWSDKHHINTFMRRLFRKNNLARHSINSMIVGLWIWLQGAGEFRRKDMDRIAVAMLLHDVGMCKVPPFLLSKAGPLKQEEREKIIPHPIVGVRLMQKMEVSFDELLRACFEHHERLDGSGYPQHTKGNQTTKVGRLAAVADSFAAMICDRPFRKGKDIVQSAKELANDPRYDQEMANALFGGFAAGTIGQMVDMDAVVDTPQPE